MRSSNANPNPNLNPDAGKGEVIQCWDEAVAAMSLGERAMVTCSADTAYGDRGAGGPSSPPPPTCTAHRLTLLVTLPARRVQGAVLQPN